MLKLFRIRGASLAPELKDGDIVLALTARRLWRLRAGQRVLFRQPGYGLLIKKIDHLLADGRLFVVGTAPSSIDSYEFGPIAQNDVAGVVVMILNNQDAHGPS